MCHKVAVIAEEDLAEHHPAEAMVAGVVRAANRPVEEVLRNLVGIIRDGTVVDLWHCLGIDLPDAGWRPAFSPRSPSGGSERGLLLS